MKKNFFKACLLAAVVAMAVPVIAGAEEKGAYITPKLVFSAQEAKVGAPTLGVSLQPLLSLNAGIDYLKDSSDDTTYGIGFALGTYLKKDSRYPIRVELEYIYRGEATHDAKGALDGPLASLIGDELLGLDDFTGASISQKFDVTTHTLMANIFMDIKTGTPITPYVGGGIGLAYIDADYKFGASAFFDDGQGNTGAKSLAASNSDTTINFAWNLGAGVVWDFTPCIALDFGYRYYFFGDAAEGSTQNGLLLPIKSKLDDYKAHEFSIGLRYSF